jgi:hypothetical protein
LNAIGEGGVGRAKDIHFSKDDGDQIARSSEDDYEDLGLSEKEDSYNKITEVEEESEEKIDRKRSMVDR